MQSAIEKLGELERSLKISVPKEQVSAAYHKKLNEISKTANLKGFRPGKVPVNLIESRYGESICQEIAGELLEQSFKEAVQEHDLRVVGMPEIDLKKIVKDEPLEYEAKFEVYPNISLKELNEVSIEKLQVGITDKDVDKILNKIREENPDWRTVDRAAKEKDQLTLDFEGFIDGHPLKNGKAKDFRIVIGSKQMIPGFEEGLVGAKVNEPFETKVKFPADYHAQDIAGKEATFKITVHKIEEPEALELGDELAKKLGVKDGLEALKNEIRKNLELDAKQVVEGRLKNQVLEKLLELNPIVAPKSLIDAEIKHLQEMTKQQAKAAGMDENNQVELPTEPFREQAEKRVKLGLLMSELIKTYELKVDQDKVRDKIYEITAQYPNAQEMVNWYYRNKEMLANVEAAVLEEQVVERLSQGIKLDTKNVSYDELADIVKQQGN